MSKLDLTGQRFGMLVAKRPAPKQNNGTAWYCDCDCGNKDVIVRTTYLRSGAKTHCGCAKSKEGKDWDNLYEYVKRLLNYDENQSLPKQTILRLKGLSTSKFIENKLIQDNSNYSYEVILNTFKLCSSMIENALRTKTFKDESHKLNYIIKIVEPKINDVYIKMKRAEKAKKEAQHKPIEVVHNDTAKYKPKNKKKDKFSDLW